MHSPVPGSQGVYLHAVRSLWQGLLAHPQLRHLVKSPYQAQMLVWLFADPRPERSTVDLASWLNASPSRAARDVELLLGTGLVVERKRWGLRLLRANLDNALARPITDLLATAYRPVALLAEVFSAVPTIEKAYLYGPMAARFLGEPQPICDIDVLVVGPADEGEIAAAARAGESWLGCKVHVLHTTRLAWRHRDDDPDLYAMGDQPVIQLDLDAERMRLAGWSPHLRPPAQLPSAPHGSSA